MKSFNDDRRSPHLMDFWMLSVIIFGSFSFLSQLMEYFFHLLIFFGAYYENAWKCLPFSDSIFDPVADPVYVDHFFGAQTTSHGC